MKKIYGIKTRILLTFVLIMTLFIAVLARGGYLTTRKIYLDEARSYLMRLTLMIGNDINKKYLPYLLPENDTAANIYYRNAFQLMTKASGVSDIFIFNIQKQVILDTNAEMSAERLYLSKTEIESLKPGDAHVSVPFATPQGTWYLWGFYRLNDNYFAGIRESVGALEPLNNLGRFFILISIGTLLVIVAASFIIARSIARPIEQLAGFSGEIALAGSAVQPPAPMSGELAVLRDAMVRMQADIRDQNEQRENMLAQIAHEIRNPLAGVELLTGLIDEDAQEHLAIRENAQKIKEQVQGLKGQLTAFLEYSRPAEPHPENVELKDIPAALMPSFAAIQKEKDIWINFDNLKGKMYFDRGQLLQVLLNLLGNAVEASSEHSEIYVYSTAVENGLRIIVEDKGEGVAEADWDKLFKPFFTTRSMGTGLGLAVCRKLCHANQAGLHLDPAYKNGARFMIDLQNNIGAL